MADREPRRKEFLDSTDSLPSTVDPILSRDRESSRDLLDPELIRLERRFERALQKLREQMEANLNVTLSLHIKDLKDHIGSAFPNADLYGHRIAHEKQIKTASRWDEMKAQFISRAFTGIATASGIFLLMLVWEYLKAELQR